MNSVVLKLEPLFGKHCRTYTVNPFGLKALQKLPVSGNPQEKGGGEGIEVPPKLGGDTGYEHIDFSHFVEHLPSIEHLKASGSEGEMVSTMTDTKVHGGEGHVPMEHGSGHSWVYFDNVGWWI